MPGRNFLDTNVLVYTDDLGEPRKRETALALVELCMRKSSGVVSSQPALQAMYLKDTFVKLNAIPDVKKIIFYDMVDGGLAKDGLLKNQAEGFMRKPSFTSIETYLRSIP